MKDILSSFKNRDFNDLYFRSASYNLPANELSTLFNLDLYSFNSCSIEEYLEFSDSYLEFHCSNYDLEKTKLNKKFEETLNSQFPFKHHRTSPIIYCIYHLLLTRVPLSQP